MKNSYRLIVPVLALLLSLKANAGELKSFSVGEVKILAGPFYDAQMADLKYILELDADRLLAPYLKDAGFKPVKDNYGNWENGGLDGHIGGHYLSALSLMYTATGNEELLRRIDYMINWLDSCQKKNGNGYVGGVPDGKSLWNDIAAGKVDAGGFSLSNRWVPLYNLHKLFAGLRDVYLYTNNKKALSVLVKLTDWFYNLTKNLTDQQVQDILKTEHGGINEVFAEVSQITGEKRYMDMAIRVSHRAILDPLLQHKNELAGLHANTQIPKVIGFECIADATKNADWDAAARYFWDLIVDNWTISIGGNSVREHLNPANDFSSMIESNQGPETCNTYNMLKLTKLLYYTKPESKYLDYYEKALFNHILSSEHPTHGGFVYFTPIRPQHYRVYSQPQQCFWCCVGSGLENHAKYGEMIYSHSDSALFVNLFIASSLNWRNKELKLTQNTKFPYEESTELVVETAKPKQFTLNIRKPDWLVNHTITIVVNSESPIIINKKQDFVSVSRIWKNGDKVKVLLPMKNKVEYMPDHSAWASVEHGPIVLAAITDTNNLVGLYADDSRMGHVANGPLYPINEAPFVVSDSMDFSAALKPVDNQPLTFTLSGLFPEKYKNLELKPFFAVHDARYMIYWPVVKTAERDKKLQEMSKGEKVKMELESRTLDQVAPGEQQPESDHNFKGENSRSGLNDYMHWRDATAWFSYELNDKDMKAKSLLITYFGLDKDRFFDIYIDECLVSSVNLKGENGNTFYTVEYPMPACVKQQIKHVIKFVAQEGSVAGGIYYVRLLK